MLGGTEWLLLALPKSYGIFQQDSEVHRRILHTKPGSILPVAGREASVVKIYVFPETAYKPPRVLGRGLYLGGGWSLGASGCLGER